MSATTSDNTALNDYLVTGETLFVTASVLAFLSEIVLTFRSLVLLNWIGLALGTIFILGVLYFINWVYSGKKEARTPAAIWAGVQIAIAVLGTLLLLNREFRWDYRFYRIGDVLPQALSVSSSLFGLFKIAAYSFFAYSITQRGPALFFLRHKDGEAIEPPSPTAPPEDLKPSGVVLPLAADQTAKGNSLANIMQCAGFALMAFGFFEAIVGGQSIATNPTLGWLRLGSGVIYLVVGLLSLNPVSALRNITERGADTAYVADALAKLNSIFSKLWLLAAILVAFFVIGLVFVILKR